MDEEEECLPESSSLNTYLQNLGYSDVQVTKHEVENLKFKFFSEKSNSTLGVIDKFVIEQVEAINSKKLLFEEDFSFVQILLSNFKVVNNGTLKIMFQDLFGVLAIILGLCLYLVIGYFAFVIISLFYLYKSADYYPRKSLVEINLENLTKVLRDNSSTLKKSVDFINAKKHRFLLSQLNNSELFQENEVDFYFYSRFKSDFLSSANEMINILVTSTQKLIKKIPLTDCADIPEYYLCSNFEINRTYDEPSKLYLFYLLLQSEFLKRVILSLIPNIHLFPKNKNKNFNALRKIIRETNVNLMKVKKNLQNRFYHASYYNLMYKSEPLKKEREPGRGDAAEFISSFHNISNIFADLVLKCRFIEESISSDKLSESIEAELIKLQTATKDCLRNIESSFILLKKANAVTDDVKQGIVQIDDTAINGHYKNIDNCSMEKISAELENMTKEGINLQEEEIETNNDNLSKTDGYDDCMVEDDVFEAYISDENQNTEFHKNDWDLEELSKKTLKREFSQNVMKELKGRLLEKAKNWKKREIDVLKKKGLIDNNNEKLLEELEVEGEIEPIEKNKETYYEDVILEKPEISFDRQIVKNFLGKTAEDTSVLDDQLETQHCFGKFCKEFLKDLSETRKLIFTAPIAEEEFSFGTTKEEPFDDISTE